MRLLRIAAVIAPLVATVVAWSKEDHEIFRIRDEVDLAEGPGTTFYDFIGITKGTGSPSTSIEAITKAYKKTSVLLHPDKVRLPARDPKLPPLSKSGHSRQLKAARKIAQERYSRLSVVADILRSPDRDRYDHFLKNGFPIWKGSGYYYARFRPGLFSVLLGLSLMVGGAGHYGVQILRAKQQRKFIQSYIDEARSLAWGPGGIPGVPTVGANGEVVTSSNGKNGKVRTGKRKVIAQNGMVFLVDASGDVSLIEEFEGGKIEEYPCSIMLQEVKNPAWNRTWLVTLPAWAWNRTLGRLTGKTFGPADDVDDDESTDDEPESTSAKKSKNNAKLAKGKGKPIDRIGMADGMPRKRVRRNRRPLKGPEDDDS